MSCAQCDAGFETRDLQAVAAQWLCPQQVVRPLAFDSDLLASWLKNRRPVFLAQHL